MANDTACTIARWIAAGNAVCAAALIAGGCALPGQQYQDQLDTWIGATEEELVRWFGPPARSDADGAGRELQWEYRGEVESSSGPVAGGPVSVGFTMTSTHTCRLSFRLVDGVATRAEWRATRSAILKAGDVELNHAGPCAVAFHADRDKSNRRAFSGTHQRAETDDRRNRWEEGVDTWVGRPVSELRDAYPVPPAVYRLEDGRRLLTWEDTSLVETAASVADPSGQTTRLSANCAMTFWVADEVVQEWRWRGSSRRECPLPESSD